MTEAQSNITICLQFLGSMATKIYQEGNYTLDHSLRGHGDSSCLLRDDMIAGLNEFDVAFVQEVAWWTNLKNILDSPTSPSEWISKMVPMMYYDAMEALLSKLSQRTKTVFVLGQTGVDCKNKSKYVFERLNNVAQLHHIILFCLLYIYSQSFSCTRIILCG